MRPPCSIGGKRGSSPNKQCLAHSNSPDNARLRHLMSPEKAAHAVLGKLYDVSSASKFVRSSSITREMVHAASKNRNKKI